MRVTLLASLVAVALIIASDMSFYREVAVPCSTDQDCAEKNPTLSGMYAFPEKAR